MKLGMDFNTGTENEAMGNGLKRRHWASWTHLCFFNMQSQPILSPTNYILYIANPRQRLHPKLCLGGFIFTLNNNNNNNNNKTPFCVLFEFSQKGTS